MTQFRPLLLACALSAGGLATPAQAEGYALYESEASFDDVLDALQLAIEERGLYINNIMHMNEMLERTGKDLGATGPIYTKAESIEFCSAVLSRKMTLEDPRRIVNCPFIISVYRLPDSPDKTFVVHRVIPTAETAASPVMQEVADMLKGVAEAAVDW